MLFLLRHIYVTGNGVYKNMTDKVSRGLRIDKKMDDHLVRICEARGVTVNSWLLNVVGEAIYKALSQERMEAATTEATIAALQNLTSQLKDVLGDSD